MTDAITRFEGPHAWLSNFEPVDVVLDRATYPSVEHAYQAAKHKEPAVREKLRNAPTAGAAKHQSRLWPTTTPNWPMVKVAVMRHLLEQKFADPDLGQRLLDTGSAYLEEGNWWGDTFWGVCNGNGENRLGRLLMEIRESLGGTGVVNPLEELDLDLDTDLSDDDYLELGIDFSIDFGDDA